MLNNVQATKKHKAARYYAEKFGWQVFPVANHGKVPITKNGVKDATSQLDLIDARWTNAPNANIGIATGQASGFIVVDLDQGGEESLEKLENEYSKLPKTVESITGGGGRHILLKIPIDFKGQIRNKVNLLHGIDIRADGGYIVAPPSLHNSGKFYEWELSSRPNEIQMQEIPAWLLKLLTNPTPLQSSEESSQRFFNDLEFFIQGLREGEGRNHAAASLVGYLFRRYVDPFLAVEIMRMWNQRNQPPLGEDELHRTINSIAGRELRRRGGK